MLEKEMEMLSCTLLCGKYGNRGTSVPIYHFSALVLLYESFQLWRSPCPLFGGSAERKHCSLVWKSVMINFPKMKVFLMAAVHLWETKLNAQLGPFLEVISGCLVALRPRSM